MMADYTELVKRLRYCSKEPSGCGLCALSSDCVLRVRLLTQAADAIDELRQTVEHYKGCSDDWYREACDYKAMLHRWIPVTERLPAPGRDVLVYVYDKEAELGYCTCAYRYNLNGEWVPDASFVDGCDIMAWMPLPEPPKEDEV